MAEQPVRWEGSCAPVLDTASLLLGGRGELVLLQAQAAVALFCSTGTTHSLGVWGHLNSSRDSHLQ